MRGDGEAAGVPWDQRGWPAHPRQGAGGRSAGGASARKRLRAVDPPKGARDLVASIPQGAGRSPPPPREQCRGGVLAQAWWNPGIALLSISSLDDFYLSTRQRISGLSRMREELFSHLVVSDSLRPHGL